MGGGQFYHLDAYRLKDAREAEQLDLQGLIETGPLVIEWAERIEPALPADCLWVNLRAVDVDQRDLVFSARGSEYESLLVEFRRRIYGGL